MAKSDALIDDRHRRPRRRRWLLAVAAVMLVAAGVAGGRWWSESSADSADSNAESGVPTADGAVDAAAEATSTTAQLIDVTAGDVAESLSAEGTVAAAETEDLTFGSAGTVTEVRVAVGDVVSSGRVLATMDSAELEASLAEAEADYAELVAQLAEDEDNDASDEQLAADQARVDVAADAVADAEEALDGARLVSTVAGTVTAVNISAGEELGSGGSGGVSLTGSGSGSGNSASQLGSSSAMGASSGQTTSTADIQLVSTGRYVVELSIDSSDIDSVAVGQEVTIEATTSSSSSSSSGGFPGGGGGFPGGDSGGFPGGGAMTGGDSGGMMPGGGQDAQGDDAGAGEDGEGDDAAAAAPETTGASVTGTVTEVSAIADASSGVASYTVTIEFEDESGDFLVGTSVVADITTSERTDVIQIPSMAITTSDEGSTVLVALEGSADGATETRVIETGESTGGMIEVVSGLSAGEQIVVEMPSGMPTDRMGATSRGADAEASEEGVQ